MRSSIADLDGLLLSKVEASWADGAERAGDWLVCRSGCSECCHGPFPITQLDASRLRRGMEALRLSNPQRASEILERARRAWAEQAPHFPQGPLPGLMSLDFDLQEAFLDRFSASPCPALDPESGACLLYEHRPLSCRTYGLPTRIGRQDLPHCHLCFQGAGADVIEACRVEHDGEGLEAALLDLVEDSRAPESETTIAWVLAEEETSH